jgi:hypothetical protein
VKPLSLGDYHALFRAVGAVLVRQSRHEQWRLPNGRMFTLPISKGGWSSRNDVHCRWRDVCRLMPELRAAWEALT